MTEEERLLADLARKVTDLEHRFDLADQAVADDFREIRGDIARLKELAPSYVTSERYRPVERLVYGFVGLVLTAVILALLAIVVRSQP